MMYVHLYCALLILYYSFDRKNHVKQYEFYNYKTAKDDICPPAVIFNPDVEGRCYKVLF
jgi:hypothetical protein